MKIINSNEKWSLFLDDIRNPKENRNWKIARSVEEAKKLIKEYGFPEYASLDHDLGFLGEEFKDESIQLVKPEEFNENEPSGYEFAKWIVEQDLNGEINIPSTFEFNVHSANPIGAKNISSLLNNYLKRKFTVVEE